MGGPRKREEERDAAHDDRLLCSLHVDPHFVPLPARPERPDHMDSGPESPAPAGDRTIVHEPPDGALPPAARAQGDRGIPRIHARRNLVAITLPRRDDAERLLRCGRAGLCTGGRGRRTLAFGIRVPT